jgi:TonB family protein
MRTEQILAGAAATASLLAAAGVSRAQDAASAPAHGRVSMDCAPVYPGDAVRKGVQGTSHLSFHVDATGQVTQGEIVEPSGPTREHHRLDLTAVRAIARCPFDPARDDSGRPVASVTPIHYTWKLQ